MYRRYMAAKRQHNLSWFPTRPSQSCQRDYYVGTNNMFLVDSTSGSVCDVCVCVYKRYVYIEDLT